MSKASSYTEDERNTRAAEVYRLSFRFSIPRGGLAKRSKMSANGFPEGCMNVARALNMHR